MNRKTRNYTVCNSLLAISAMRRGHSTIVFKIFTFVVAVGIALVVLGSQVPCFCACLVLGSALSLLHSCTIVLVWRGAKVYNYFRHKVGTAE